MVQIKNFLRKELHQMSNIGAEIDKDTMEDRIMIYLYRDAESWPKKRLTFDRVSMNVIKMRYC